MISVRNVMKNGLRNGLRWSPLVLQTFFKTKNALFCFIFRTKFHQYSRIGHVNSNIYDYSKKESDTKKINALSFVTASFRLPMLTRIRPFAVIYMCKSYARRSLFFARRKNINFLRSKVTTHLLAPISAAECQEISNLRPYL